MLRRKCEYHILDPWKDTGLNQTGSVPAHIDNITKRVLHPLSENLLSALLKNIFFYFQITTNKNSDFLDFNFLKCISDQRVPSRSSVHFIGG